MIENRPDLSGVTQAVYGDYANQLTAISEISDLTRGFKKISSGADGYEYDNNGNLTADGYRGITSITYNHLNLPAKITYSATKYLELTYDASGRKWKKTTMDRSTTTEKYYFGPIEYNGSTLEALYHEEGRAVPDGNGGYDYEYAIRDHLGSTRVMFEMVNGVATLIEENHYYPFGMSLDGPAFVGGGNPYRYTGKELNEDLDLGLYDFGARWYDPAAARWWGVDAMGDHPLQIDKSPYAAMLNNPIRYDDPDGNCPFCPWLDAVVDVGFIVYDVGKLTYDKITTGSTKSEDWAALGADVASIVVPMSVGAGAVVRTTMKTANKVENAAKVTKTEGKVSDAISVVEKNNGTSADFVVTPEGVAVPTSQTRMREGFDNAGFEKQPATKTNEPGEIHTVPTNQGNIDVRTMEGSGFNPKRAIFTESGSNSSVKVGGEKFRNNENKQIRREQSHLIQKD